MTLELLEMVWTLSPEEAQEGEAAVEAARQETLGAPDDWMSSREDDMELIEGYLDDDPEPHELEELCFIIVQEFVTNTADGTPEKQELHSHLLKLQEQIAGAFIHLGHDGTFGNIPATVRLLNTVIPLIDRTAASARFLAETTHEHVLELRIGIIALRDELAAQIRG